MESQHQNALHTIRRHRQQLTAAPTGATTTHYLPALLIAVLVLLQHMELHMCRQVTPSSTRRLMPRAEADRAATPPHEFVGSAAAELDDSSDKRATVSGLGSQPEQIFNAPSAGDMDMSYDEYPMIVPKRAALLLDRLMVALHHALENERGAHRISDYYTNKNIHNAISNEYNNGLENHTNTNFHQYSDDDPSILLDYDFKDLSQINRATGETLMPKSFQRRANMGIGGGGAGGVGATDGVALLTNSASLQAGAGSGGGGGGGGVGSGSTAGGRRLNVGSGGRMYWRCYFNAVSCF
ncbi:uncharacterized protein LOC115631333 [Scaptodrosophila lebanonensis]|uniref:Uncharacterized protein LOC115631333 n=1 Tax=Drosophila lebanonensis TaxID=7225 RepID=A0A6J2U6G0_DROLE|nr:uncharacterized protein LOC115631333 [Scaptodrosophila lebanonensis]